MNETEVKQASFSGWAIVEMMGHRKEIGFVTTEAFGQAILFRVDTPELPERDFILTAPEYAQTEAGSRCWCPAGTQVKRQAAPARSCLVATSSLYAINPCSEAAARTAIEHSSPRPLILLGGSALMIPAHFLLVGYFAACALAGKPTAHRRPI
jgi:hypothetical protein